MNDTPPQTPQRSTFSGRERQRTTSPRVKYANIAARLIITLGGIGTIVAVSLVCVFLVSVVIPLFVPAEVSKQAIIERPDAARADAQSPPAILHLAMDEYKLLAFGYYADGTVRTFNLATGTILDEKRPFGDTTPTAHSFAIRDGNVAFGFADGTVRYGVIDFGARFIDPAQLPAEVTALQPGQSVAYDDGVIEKTPENQYRLQSLRIELGDPVQIEKGSPVKLVDISLKSTGPVIAAMTESNTLHISEVSSRKNLMTGKVTVTLSGGKLQLNEADAAKARWLLIAGLGDNVFLGENDGKLLRLDTRNIRTPAIVETVDLTPDSDARLTALGFQIGKTSLVSGDSDGRVRVWSRIKPDDATTPDGVHLVEVHDLSAPSLGSPVTTLAASARTRMLAAGNEAGTVFLYHVTSNQTLARVEQPDGVAASAIRALALAPKDDGILTATDSHLGLWQVDAPHPESTLAAIFTPVWYEGYTRPEHVWQSSSGTDDFEPKYGLYPLIFGTTKATVYSMLFGVPLALLAAVYSSEFMNPKVKAKVKPTIEMMASLPSVVLGFLAALVVAPFVEDIVPQLLACFLTIPFTILLGAYLWQLMPVSLAVRIARFRLAFMIAAIPVGVWAGFLLGPRIERWMFAGDIKAWLTGGVGGGTGAWMFLLIPASALLVALVNARFINPAIRQWTMDWSRQKAAFLDLAKFLVLSLLTIGLAMVVSSILSFIADPRGTFVDTYVQRNALVVGFIMGFAIIPIIYTITEDAFSAVPEHLRSGSLGCGATPWQTATRIIIPTAMSGVFSALMIGLGRAVGETMIVLMAAGNTPVMEWNIFNGFRTLSANIAVELPEAVKHSTHYRMLFLAALTLFAMTFVVNTVAEVVRLRFRKRAYQL